MRVDSRLSVTFHQFIPATFYGGCTAFATLSQIDTALRECRSAREAAGVVARVKPELFTLLRRRWDAPLAQALTLKMLNLCLAKYHMRARSAMVLSRPFGLVVDPSNVCQLACPGCVHSSRNEELKIFDWPKGTLGKERFDRLMRQYGPYAVGVYFCDYGEPLLNLATPELIRTAKRYLAGTALSTSLSVRRFDPEAYVASGLDFMVMSIDGATQSVYERFRRGGSLQLVLENVRKMVDAKHRMGKRTPALSWNFLAFEHNAHEIPLAARMARELGVDQFRVVHPFDVTWDDPAIRPAAVPGRVRRLSWNAMSNRPENWNPFPESVDADAMARAFEKPWDALDAADGEPSAGHTCHWLYKNMLLDATGRILPCCGAPRPDSNLVFGTFDGTGADAFNSERYRQARAFFAGGTAGGPGAPHCTQCEWDQTTVNIGGPEIRRYFRAADAAFFDRRSLRLLSDW